MTVTIQWRGLELTFEGTWEPYDDRTNSGGYLEWDTCYEVEIDVSNFAHACGEFHQEWNEKIVQEVENN